MVEDSNEKVYCDLRDALLRFVANHDDPDMLRFKTALLNWGNTSCSASTTLLPAADSLAAAMDHAIPSTRALLAPFVRYRNQVRWEQSYTRATSPQRKIRSW